MVEILELYDAAANPVHGTRVAPAAGADVSISVPNGALWRIVALRATFTASGNAANRYIGFQVQDQSGAVVYAYNITAAVTAGLAGVFTFSRDVASAPTAFATTNRLLLPAPATPIPALWSFGTSTLNIDATDAWTAVTLWVEQLGTSA